MYQAVIKRLLDIIISLLFLPLLIVLSIPIGLAIFFEDRGSLFYNAKRLGKGMQEFKMYKFRSMIENAPDLRNADGSTFNNDNDQRVTKVGKFLRKTSLDEVPQLLNVLKGDMSLVGPRPSPLGNVSQYPERYIQKFDVRPGITGYNQAVLRNSSTMDERIDNDVFYVNNISFVLDMKIIYWTVKTVLASKNINRNG